MAVKGLRLFQWLLLAGLICLLTIACNQAISTNPSLTREIAPVPPTRLIQHALGEVQIPAQPQRVVTLHDSLFLSPAIALGVKPIATTTYGATDGIPFRGVTPEQVEGIEILGDGHQPNLERLLSVNPDLILATGSIHQSIYGQLSAIAPTVVANWDDFNSFKDWFRYVADTLNRTNRANELLTQYQERVNEFRQAMGDRLDELRVSFIYVYGGPLSTLDSSNMIYEIFSDVGLKLIPIQEKMAHRGSLNFSLEDLPKHDANFLFIGKYPSEDVDSILNNPIWQQLNAVKSGQVYEVSPQKWAGSCTITANEILDDLFKYLLDEDEPSLDSN
jgi:iron complex transport system substrate-binding protein